MNDFINGYENDKYRFINDCINNGISNYLIIDFKYIKCNEYNSINPNRLVKLDSRNGLKYDDYVKINKLWNTI